MQIVIIVVDTVISIHALLAESDDLSYFYIIKVTRFLSTLSLRRATLFQAADISARRISIHALLAESDRGIRRYLATWK